MTDFEQFPAFNDFNACPSNVDDWCEASGTPDLFIRGSQKDGPNQFPVQGIPDNFFIQNLDTHNGTPNDRYVGMWQRQDFVPEAIWVELDQTLDPNSVHRIDFWVAAKHTSGDPPSLALSLSASPPSVRTPEITAIALASFTVGASAGWTHVEHTIPANSLPSGTQYLIFQPPTISTGFNYIFVDDVRLEETEKKTGPCCNHALVGQECLPDVPEDECWGTWNPDARGCQVDDAGICSFLRGGSAVR